MDPGYKILVEILIVLFIIYFRSCRDGFRQFGIGAGERSGADEIHLYF